MAKKSEKLHPALLYELRRIPKRVAAGVKLLSKHSDAPWWHHMSIKNLFMENGAACLIGQQPIEFVIAKNHDIDDYGSGFSEDFGVKCKELGLGDDEKILEHGFVCPTYYGQERINPYDEYDEQTGEWLPDPGNWTDIYYVELTTEWKRTLKTLKALPNAMFKKEPYPKKFKRTDVYPD